MAIRPTDLQSSLINQTQAQPIAQRAEEAPRQAQAAAQAAFVNETARRNETVLETGNSQGNKIAERPPDPDEQGGGRRGKRERKPGDPFEETVAEASGEGDAPHLIDFTA